MPAFARFLLLTTVLSTACGGWEDDLGFVCVQVSDDLTTLEVTASSDDCAADHEGADFTCTSESSGSEVTVSTATKGGRDPNDGCAGPLIAECDLAMPSGDGALTVSFGDESEELARSPGEAVCVPHGDLETVVDG